MTVGSKNRVTTLAADHDFKPTAILTPVGIFLPQYNELYLFFLTSKVTADCLVDLLEHWWYKVRDDYLEDSGLTILVSQDGYSSLKRAKD